MDLLKFPHVFLDCARKNKPGHADRYCPTCDGGLLTCGACGASEGELLVNCPGFPLSAEAREACYKGNVVDLCGLRRHFVRSVDGTLVPRCYAK